MSCDDSEASIYVGICYSCIIRSTPHEPSEHTQTSQIPSFNSPLVSFIRCREVSINDMNYRRHRRGVALLRLLTLDGCISCLDFTTAPFQQVANTSRQHVLPVSRGAWSRFEECGARRSRLCDTPVPGLGNARDHKAYQSTTVHGGKTFASSTASRLTPASSQTEAKRHTFQSSRNGRRQLPGRGNASGPSSHARASPSSSSTKLLRTANCSLEPNRWDRIDGWIRWTDGHLSPHPGRETVTVR